MTRQAYASANCCEKFVQAISAGQTEAKNQGATFDAVESGIFDDAPALVQGLVEALPTYETKTHRTITGADAIVRATMDGVNQYTKMHGVAPSGGLIASAVQNAYATVSPDYRRSMNIDRRAVWDDTSNISDAPMISNIAQLAIYSTLTEAIPFGGYVPMDNGLLGQLMIVGHTAASNAGAYKIGDNLDGIHAGKPFMSSNRTVKATDGGAHTTYTAKVLHADTDSNGAPVIPSTVQVLVNGIPAGRVAVTASRKNATVPIAGGVTLSVGGVDKNYSVTGSLTTASGEVSVTFDPALEGAHEVFVSACIDYEHASMSGKRPEVRADAISYDLTAYITSGLYQVTQEAKMQWEKEVRLNPEAEAMMTLRQQSAAERHFEAVRSMYRIGKNYIEQFDVKATSRLDARSRASLFDDAFIAITLADQKMLERTNSFGIGVIYVGSKGKAYFESLPSTLFAKSGNPTHTGIHRIGTLQGKYQVYYVPGIVNETANSFEMLAVGRSAQIGLNPFIVGDVVGATMLPLGVGRDLTQGMGYFQAGVGTVNPHAPSATGAAIIQFTNVN